MDKIKTKKCRVVKEEMDAKIHINYVFDHLSCDNIWYYQYLICKYLNLMISIFLQLQGVLGGKTSDGEGREG